MEKTKKVLKVFVLIVGIASILTLTSCASLLASMFGFEVNAPENSDSSLLFVELVAYTWDQSGAVDDSLIQVNYMSGFFPVVVDERGEELPFSVIEGLTTAGLIYYRENISSGKYTLKGFRYLWMSRYAFMNSPIKDLKFDGQRSDWVEVQFYELPEPITIDLKAGTADSLGRYKVYYELREYDYTRNDNLKREDDSYKMILFRYEDILPKDTSTLELMKQWKYKPWQLWAQRSTLSK